MGQILIIDDSSFSRKLLRRMVESAGHDVIEAGGGRQGLEMIQKSPPHCVLLDLTMPDLDGFGVLAELQKAQSNVPVIVHTADAQERTHTQCMGLGARAVLHKPFNNMDLSGLLETLSFATQTKVA